MSYLPKAFPSEHIARGAMGGPGWATSIATTLAGDEQRNQTWERSRHRYEVSHGVKLAAGFRAIGAHFRMARGKTHHFRFRDWGDFRCARADGLLDEITTTTFQLTKVYGDQTGFKEERRITRPVAASVQIWKTGTLQTLTTHYTLDAETGIVTFLGAPGAATIECAFDFDVPCRYDTDELRSTLLIADGGPDEAVVAWESVPIVEVRE